MPPITLWREFGYFTAKFAGPVEEFFRKIALHPVFQNLEMTRLGRQIRDRHLVRAPCAFDRFTVHNLRPVQPFGVRITIIGQTGRVLDPRERASPESP